MTEQKNQLASLFAACWKDEALKARFMSPIPRRSWPSTTWTFLMGWMSKWWRTLTTAYTSRCLHRPAARWNSQMKS